jgi:hypothetical protein
MVYIFTLIVSVIIWIWAILMQNLNGMGEGWRIANLIFLLFFGLVYIFIGIIAPPGPRSVLFQIGAALLTTIPICIAYVSYKNKHGWW